MLFQFNLNAREHKNGPQIEIFFFPVSIDKILYNHLD